MHPTFTTFFLLIMLLQVVNHWRLRLSGDVGNVEAYSKEWPEGVIPATFATFRGLGRSVLKIERWMG